MALYVEQQSPLIAISTAGEPGRDGKDGVDGQNGSDGKNGSDGRNGFGAAYRPGDAPGAFTATLAGGTSATPPLPAAGVVADPIEGNVYNLAGPGTIALREPLWLEPEAFYAIRIVFERFRDPPVYEVTTVVVGVQWLDASFKPLEQGVAQVFKDFLVATGRQVFTARVPAAAGDGVPLDPPPGAVFWRPFLQDASNSGVLRVLSMTVSDVTGAGVYAPDLTRFGQRLAALESAAGFRNPPFGIVRVPPCKVVDLPAPGIRGRKGFAIDGRAVTADGSLEIPGKGSGVDVSDNGQAWVRIGTNQAVQA